MGPCTSICFAVLSLMIFDVVRCRLVYNEGRALQNDDVILPGDNDIKPLSAVGEPQNTEEENLAKIQRYLGRIAYLYSKTKRILKDLKSTMKHKLSESVDDLGKDVDGMVYHKISFIRPYLPSLMRANFRSLLGNMMKRMRHHGH